MDTLKTAVVVVLLLGVLYGVYVVLNQSERMPSDVAWPEQQGDPAVDIELGTPESDAEFGAGGYAAETASATSTAPHSEHTAGSHGPSNHHAHHEAPSAEAGDPSVAHSETAGSGHRSTETIAPPELLGADAKSDGSGTSNVPDQGDLAGGGAGSPAQAAQDESDATAHVNGADSSRHGEFSTETPVNQPNDYLTLPNNSTAESNPTGGPPDPSPYTDEKTASVDSDSAASQNEEAVGVGESQFEGIMQSVETKIAKEEWYEALMKLTFAYSSLDLTSEEKQQALNLLDPLAGKVIYSTEHLIEAPYEVQTGETLFDIAKQREVPWQLLANINGVQDPESLAPGSQLKVLAGPFRAEISLADSELTLYVNKLYAGRFPISVGNDPKPEPTEYTVHDKQPGRTYYAGDGRTIPIDDPSNPYGRVWIDLGGDVCIHGTPPNIDSEHLGCISLSPIDAGDIYGILSKGSSVVITR